jgi:hypothetical protein
VGANGRRRQFINTPIGNKLSGNWVVPLADFLAGKRDDKPDEPPRFAQGMIRELNDYKFLALATLAPLLDAIFRDWDHKYKSAIVKLVLRIGDDVCKRLRTKVESAPKRFSAKQKTKLGYWLYDQAMKGLDIFDDDENELPIISDKHLDDAASLREWLIATNPSFAPRLMPPSPWTGCSKTCDGFEARFVKDWSRETDPAIDAAFSGGDFEHAGAVNKLAQVAIVPDPVMVDLVERLGPDIMGNTGRKLKADKVTVAADVADARWCLKHGMFWLDYNCDFRGRLNPLQNLNFTRGDHVRSLFRFAHGLPINGDTYWLEIHCANCEGSTDKESRDDQIRWVAEHLEEIKRIAADPDGTRDKIVLGGKGWKNADKPFQFVAACRELAAALVNPDGFITHLPIGFDGSCNGTQHLALLIRDFETARRVNLLPAGDGDKPLDIYTHVTTKTIELIDADTCDHARWWRERFKQLDARQKRRLLKQPIMTFGYSVTDRGAGDQISEDYREIFRTKGRPELLVTSLGPNHGPERLGAVRWHEPDGTSEKHYLEQASLRDVFDDDGRLIGVFEEWHRIPDGVFIYLAEKVREACKQELPGAERVMDYLGRLTKHCLKEGRFLTWVSPSGFPVENRYRKPNTIRVNCASGSVRVRLSVADGVTDKINRKKVKSGAAANFVHSLDAAHLAKVVNAAVSAGITNLATIHDCFYCLAPQASQLLDIILEQLVSMYKNHNPLTDLSKRNDPEGKVPLPPMGEMIEFKLGGWMARYIKLAQQVARPQERPLTRYRAVQLDLEQVKKAKNSFK